jgi:hypothetical protein
MIQSAFCGLYHEFHFIPKFVHATYHKIEGLKVPTTLAVDGTVFWGTTEGSPAVYFMTIVFKRITTQSTISISIRYRTRTNDVSHTVYQ